MTQPFIIEPLSAKHNRIDFDCGEESLNNFLKHFARQNSDKGLGRTYVAVKKEMPDIYGSYTISSGSLTFETIPEKLPRYPIPVVHLGRLAVDKRAQGARLGKALLGDALHRAVNLADQLGIFAVEVYALTENARNFYLKFGFTPLLDDELHLYLSIKKIRNSLL